MPPKSSPLDVKWPSKNKSHQDVSANDAIHTVVPPRSPHLTTHSSYEEAQNDELQVLQSVYPDEYEQIESRSAWAKTSEKSFKLRLRAPSDADCYVVMAATLTATYPKTIPLLAIELDMNVRPRALEQVRSTISTLPKTLLGEVMMYEIASTVQEILEDSVIARANEKSMPSLEEERASREMAAVSLARKEEEDTAKRQAQEKVEEEQALQRMVEVERKRRDDARRRRDALSEVSNTPEVSHVRAHLHFDRDMTILDHEANSLTFRAVTMSSTVGRGPTTTVFSAAPVTKNISGVSLILKRLHIDSCHTKALIVNLEDELEKLVLIEHANALRVLDFKILADGEGRQFDVLTEYANDGSLRSLLRKCGVVQPDKARTFAIDMLQGLDHYHKRGLSHGSLHLGNVLLCSSSTGGTVAKLSDAAFQVGLRNLKHDSLRATNKRSAYDINATNMPSGWQCSGSSASRAADIWSFGVVLTQLLFGIDVVEKYSSVMSFMSSVDLSAPLSDLLNDTFRSDERRRPPPFDLIPYEFLRTNAAPMASSHGLSSLDLSRMRSNHLSRRVSRPETATSVSRFASEYGEVSRLGKGGYGEVVKAKNKNDNNFYAIKKVSHKTPAELSRVLPEVHLLANLSHPYVVRYITNWLEEETSPFDSLETSSADITTSSDTNTKPSTFGFGESTGGLDFISSSGYPPAFEFEAEDENDSSESEAESADDGESADRSEPRQQQPVHVNGNSRLQLQRSKSDSKAVVKSTLYIQMEYCERLTLRDIIRRGIHENNDELWRFFKQILEGLVHVHSHGIIHRDLKPENIFVDKSNNPKIGDFGLAKTGHFHAVDQHDSRSVGGDMTRSVGTTLYVAPELRSNVLGNYTDKVDMYSLGIIFFEMCHPSKTAMERINSIQALRQKDHKLPEALQMSEFAARGEIIECLIQHRPSDRPSSAELARSPKLPVRIEDDQVRLALSNLSDSTSPYYHRMMSLLFKPSANDQLRDQTWELETDATASVSERYGLVQTFVKDRLTGVFKRHGLIETTRQGLFPRSNYYTAGNVMTMLDASGNLLQLPYDLTLPHARAIAKQHGDVPFRSYTFGHVFREAPIGGAPRSNREADIDLVSDDNANLALEEAEVVKIMDEVLDDLPCFSSTPVCFHISHSALLDLILDFCRISIAQRNATKEILGKLNIQSWTWQKIRLELRAPSIGVTSTSLDELAQFDFRDTPEKCFTKLQTMLSGSEYLPRLHSIYTHIGGLAALLKRLGVRRTVYVNPLGSFNDRFYTGATMFQCLFDGKRRDVLAAGGRYDSLINSFRPTAVKSGATGHTQFHAVGLNIAWDRIVTSMTRFLKSSTQPGAAFLKHDPQVSSDRRQDTANTAAGISSTLRRCDVLVASFDTAIRLDYCLGLLVLLWSHDIGAELAPEARTPEELLVHDRDPKDGSDRHTWILIVKHEPSATAKPELKLKNLETKEDYDLKTTDLISHLRSELRERDHRLGLKGSSHTKQAAPGAPIPSLNSSNPQGHTLGSIMPVHVLPSVRDRDSKGNSNRRPPKYKAVEKARDVARGLAQSFLDIPIASISCRDEIVDAIVKQTRISDGDSWRESWKRLANDAFPGERQYVSDIQRRLESMRSQYPDAKSCWIYNDKTYKCALYDLGRS
ncbi:MAG: hypothetical protein M1828_006362 [Chrysothrix sp. TS-e1954]|nr:MAG: hypothetical protein M1828_006362 [Chrysothrix sp. TS-e1954]